MACEQFIKWTPTAATAERLDDVVNIVLEYQDQGLRLTLRQLYYQLVSRDLIPNDNKAYRQLGSMLSQARLAGFVDWDAIEDRGRVPDIPSEWNNPQALVESAIRAYRRPRWVGQEIYAELWVEKQALAGVLEPLAQEFHAPLMVNKGYSSQSAMYESAKRILHNTVRTNGEYFRKIEPVRPCMILYLGDHDPSGEDMVRDIQDRLNMFIDGKTVVKVIKLALNWDQIEEHQPPPNPTKLTDSRAKAYVEKFGYESWEVDALPPTVLQELIRDAFEGIIDRPTMDAIIEQEALDKEALVSATEDL